MRALPVCLALICIRKQGRAELKKLSGSNKPCQLSNRNTKLLSSDRGGMGICREQGTPVREST
jgi:hypothetical protein